MSEGVVTCSICGAQQPSGSAFDYVMICRVCAAPAKDVVQGLGRLAARAMSERIERAAPGALSVVDAVVSALRRSSNAAED